MGATDRPARLVVLASGNGSNLQAIIDACADGRLNAHVVAVVTNRVEARALERADRNGIPSVRVTVHDGESRDDYDARLADVVAGFAPDLIVLAGWMRILSMSFLGWFPDRVVNLHPALPGEYPGVNAIERAWDDAAHDKTSRSGVMVHLVPDEGVDDGPVLGVREVAIDADGTFDDFADRMHTTEHELLVEVLAELCARDAASTTPRQEVHT